MWNRLALALLVFGIPAVGRAQEAPEQLLPDGAQIYFRWDGIEAHRAAYEKTAIGKMMQRDTGNFTVRLANTTWHLTDVSFENPDTTSQAHGG